MSSDQSKTLQIETILQRGQFLNADFFLNLYLLLHLAVVFFILMRNVTGWYLAHHCGQVPAPPSEPWSPLPIIGRCSKAPAVAGRWNPVSDWCHPQKQKQKRPLPLEPKMNFEVWKCVRKQLVSEREQNSMKTKRNPGFSPLAGFFYFNAGHWLKLYTILWC